TTAQIRTSVNGNTITGNTFTGTMPVAGKRFAGVGTAYDIPALYAANAAWDTAVTVRTTGDVYQKSIWANIMGGVNAASATNILHAYKGTYNEMVTIGKTMTLEGAKNGVDARTRATSDESIVSNADGDFQIEADNVVIDGF